MGKQDVNDAEREVLEQEELDYLDGDGEHLPAVEGCHLTGFVLVQKVPGSLLFSAVSPHHSFDHARVNMSHTVHNLNFGQRFEREELDVLPKQVTEAMHQLSEREFVSVGQNQSHEHYIKVVGTTFKYLDVGTLTTYKYTSMSSTYHSTTKLPIIKFHYDISPMKVVVTETVSGIDDTCSLLPYVDDVLASTSRCTSSSRPCSPLSAGCLPYSASWMESSTTRRR